MNSNPAGDYELVSLAGGERTLFSKGYGEKMHPGLGPQAEAELLYVRQLKVCERLRSGAGEFVIWDVGLGAAANAIAAFRATQEVPGRLRIVSFDNTKEPLEFALKNTAALGYLAGYENQIAELLCRRRAEFQNGKLEVIWEFQFGDFPAWLERRAPPRQETDRKSQRAEAALDVPVPHAIFYDAFSPAKNPAMWTLPLFQNLFAALDPARPCALTTYSRSTMVRTTLLLAGFYVGAGHATGLKEETTIAANRMDLIAGPLDARWLERAARSDSAEPLRKPVYQRRKLGVETLKQLSDRPQFQAVN